IHAHQYRANPPYRRFVDRTGVTPHHWTEIPAVPASAFRDSVLCCAVGARGSEARVYESSGTTEGPERRARHHVPDVAVYRAAALTGFTRALAPFGSDVTTTRTIPSDSGVAAAASPASVASLRRPFVVAAPERHSHP